MSERRVVITGMGVITPVGKDLPTFWESLKSGRSGIGRITAFDPSKFDCQIAGEVKDFAATPYFKSPKDVKRTDRYTQFAVAATKMCLEDSGLDLGAIDLDRAGVMIGSGVGGLATMEEQVTKLITRGPDRTSPFMIAMMISNMASGFISMEHRLRGPNMAIVTACATANHCMGEAWRIIKFGDADIMFAGGSEACIVQVGIAGFAAMRALSVRNDIPEKASSPFDLDRDGFVMGEGAGVLVLEEYEHAKKRGAKIYCEVAGYGLTADAYHMTAPQPQGEGAARCMRMAMKHAKVNPEDVDYINAHGTSTPIGDACETLAVKGAFGHHARQGLLVSSTKSMTGHLLGAAGAVEMAACVMAMREGIVPPTINLDHPDPQCDLDYVPNKAREKKVRVAVSNSFGFGGHNSSLLIKAI
ncbi:MAG: beta-ketoacyl-ACP synthase II [Chthoniobacterales bacterium]|jgi:3-oxoacyl-[acyl-carrier-protein] synthase II|nr:beta-ketoacyl-ACP synthase II [Chthoniobacterales bacterium]